MRLPAASRAVAVRSWLPSATVVVIPRTDQPLAPSVSVPMLAPSTKNCTDETVPASIASASTETVPLTDGPRAREDTETAGAVSSATRRR